MKAIVRVIAILILTFTSLSTFLSYTYLYKGFKEYLSSTPQAYMTTHDISLLNINFETLDKGLTGHLVLWLKFDKKNGEVVEDFSGRNYNAQLYDSKRCNYTLTYVNGSYYEFYTKGCAGNLDIYPTWSNTEKFCEREGGHLVTINDSAEEEYVYNIMYATGLWRSWIGYYQDPDDLTDSGGIPEGCPTEPDGVLEMDL